MSKCDSAWTKASKSNEDVSFSKFFYVTLFKYLQING